MSTFHASEKTHQAVLPQRPALEPVPADNPGVGTKRGMDAGLPATGVEHGRGETGDGLTYPSRRHSPKTDEPVSAKRGLAARAGEGVVPRPVAARVFVVDCHGTPLMPCHPARARQLLAKGRAVVARHTPLVIRLKDKEASECEVDGVEAGVDPGSAHTGIAVFRVDEAGARHGLVSVQVDHRGRRISEQLGSRAALRRGRRSRNLRYRARRFDNRHPGECVSCGANAQAGRDRCRLCRTARAPRRDGLRPARLAPSLRHRVEGDMAMIAKLRGWAPVGEVHMELVRFDTQALVNPEITGTGYQQGTLAGFEVREYLLVKWAHRCAYCWVSGVPLNIDHLQPRSRSGSDRVSNLAISCVPCNQAKGNRPIGELLASDPARLAHIRAQMTAPLRDAAAVNSTRWEIWRRLRETGLPVHTGTGGRTKWNRTRNQLPKSHTLDALCVGDAGRVASVPTRVVVAAATGRGSYSRTRSDRHGFPRLRLPRARQHHGFATGDLVRAVVPSGKKTGVHVGRVAVRSTGSFNIRTRSGLVQGVNHRHCALLQRGDGWGWAAQPERTLDAP